MPPSRRWSGVLHSQLAPVVQVILSLGAVGLAKRNAMVKDLSSVETLGSTSAAINSDRPEP
jgi:P-type Ca2+ transporter type 2C